MAIQLHIQLRGVSNPSVWRRVVIPDTFTFRQMHFSIQLAFDWQLQHLYQFQQQPYDQGWCIGEAEVEGRSPFFDSNMQSAKSLNVHEFIEQHQLQQFVYLYDFGDDWVHDIQVEQLTEEALKTPRCLDGEGATPPENSGGPMSYEHLKQILVKPRKTQAEKQLLQWALMMTRRPFSPDAFFLEYTQKRLRYFKSFEKQVDDIYD